MKPKRIAAEVIAKLRKASSAARRAKNEKYFPSAQAVLGVDAAGIRAVERDLKKRLAGAGAREVYEIALAIIGAGTVEGRQVAYEILAGHKGAVEALGLEEVLALGEGMDNWVSVDTFAVLVAGPAWRERRIPDSAVRAWTRSEDRWWRRAALVSTVALNLKSRGGRGDEARTLAICKRLAADHDDMVAKGLSWALRELSKRGRAPVERFLAEHEEDLPARVLREVRRKIKTGRKYG
ncbi:MAG: DNA alkylation repair protein [Deltaproteobacteria bacterium]|nr:DNA alkylation repair protein [Deltaproteobacteria bacterium]